MRRLLIGILCLVACHPLTKERRLEEYSGILPLFTLAQDFILTTQTDKLHSVVLNDNEHFDFIVSVTIDNIKYELIGTPNVLTPIGIYADAGESRIVYQCDDNMVVLSFVAPEINYGCLPVNYLICHTTKGKPLSLNVSVNKKRLTGLTYGVLPMKSKKGSIFYIGYDDGRVTQLFGRKILPIWKRDMSTEIADIISYSDIMKPAKGPVDLRIKKAKLNLSRDENGNLIYVTCYYVNRMTEIAGFADTLALFGERDLLEGLINPILMYAESELWNAPFCPPDIGAYPLIMHRISDDTNYNWITKKGLDIIANIDSLAGNKNYSQSHKKVIKQWENYINR